MLSAALALTLALSARPAAAAPALDAAQVARRDGLLERVAAHVDPAASHLAPAELEHGPTCISMLVQELQTERDLFTEAEWAWVTDRIFLVDPARTDAALAAPPAAPAEEAVMSCHGRQGANWQASEHFVVEWDSSSVTETMVTNLLTSLELSWQVFVEEKGWDAPNGADEAPLLFYIDGGNWAGAYTTIGNCSGQGYVPYMVAGRGSFSAGTWYQTMAAHEFHHAIQWGYSYAHEFYWWEATATWSEEYVYPENNDWADMYVGFPYYPYISMNASNQDDQAIFYHMYAMGIFGTFLDEYYGGHDTVQATWDVSKARSTQYNYWMPDVLDDIDLDFGEIFPHFMATTAWMDFEESRYYYTVRETGQVDEVDDLPADGDALRNAPQSLGLNYIYFDDGLGEDGRYLQIDFDGGEADYWYVVLTTGEDHALQDYVTIELDEEHQGSAWIPLDGDTEAFLVVSPVDERAVGMTYDWRDADEFEFTWEACLVDAEGGPACGEEAEGEGDGGEDDTPATPEDEGGKASTCASAPLPGLGAAWALFLLGLVALRRRR